MHALLYCCIVYHTFCIHVHTYIYIQFHTQWRGSLTCPLWDMRRGRLCHGRRSRNVQASRWVCTEFHTLLGLENKPRSFLIQPCDKFFFHHGPGSVTEPTAAMRTAHGESGPSIVLEQRRRSWLASEPHRNFQKSSLKNCPPIQKPLGRTNCCLPSLTLYPPTPHIAPTVCSISCEHVCYPLFSS